MTTSARPAILMHRGAVRTSNGFTRSTAWGRALVTVIALVWATTLVVDYRVALTLLLIIAFGLAVAGLKYPWFGLIGIGMLCTLNEVAAPLLLTGGLWRWNTVSYWLLLVTLLFAPSVLRLGRLQTRILLLVVLLLALEVLLSPDPPSGVQQVFAVVAVFGLVVYFGRAALDPEAWYWVGVVTGVLGAGGGAAFLLQQGTLPFVNHNAWPFLMLTAMLAVCLAFVVTADAPRRSFVLALLAVVNAVLIFLSGCRGCLMIAVVCLAFLLTLMKPHRALMFAMIGALISVVVMSQFTALQDKSLGRLRLLIDPNQSLTTRTSGRFELALAGWYIFQEHPLLGVGTGGFSVTRADLGRQEGLSSWHSTFSAMSGWVKVATENGLPGFLLLGAYVVSFAVSGWRARNPVLLRLGLLVSAVLTVGWISNEFQNKALWFLAAGATVLLDRPSSLRRTDASPIAGA